MTIIAAADGSALGNPGPAGWGWYVDDEHWASGGWAHGTNNMGELTAVLDLLHQTAHLDDELIVYCDSTYAINSITKWMAGWKRKGWKKGDGKPVLNVEIMKALDEAMTARKTAGRSVEFRWVKGHAGHELNEAADRLANAAAAAYQAGKIPNAGPGFGSQPSTHDFAVTTHEPEPDLFSLAGDEPQAKERQTDEQVCVELERSLLTTAVRTDPDALARLLHPQWQEIGASGRLMDREETLTSLGPIDVSLDVVNVEKLADDVVLLVWRAIGDRRSTLRSSIWKRENGRWQQIFHQGTREP